MLFVTLLLHYRNNSALPLPSSLTIARASVLAARCCASVRPMLSWVSVCLSVRLSITFVDFVKTSNRILRLFHRRVAAPFWFLHTKPYAWRYSDEDGGVECRWGMQKSRFSTNIWISDRWLVDCEQLRRSTVQLIAHTTTHQWIFVYHNQHGRPRRREQNII